MLSLDKKILLQWNSWFCLANIFLLCLLGLSDWASLPWVHSHYLSLYGEWYVMTFVISAYLGQFALFALLLFVFISVVIFLVRSNGFIFLFASTLATFIACLLLIDALIYKLYHFHLNGIMFNLIMHGMGPEILGFSKLELLFATLIPCGVLLLECGIAIFIWRKISMQTIFPRWHFWVITFFGFCIYLSCALIFYSVVVLPITSNRVLLDTARFLPINFDVWNAMLFGKKRETDIQRLASRFIVQSSQANQRLSYPPVLQYSEQVHPKNIVIILIDTWRFDMLQKNITPHLSQFAKQSWEFRQHFSGGDATAPGVFSLFYSLPPTYWDAMSQAERSPAWIEELLREHYQMGIFVSASIRHPAFDKTVFAALKNLPRDTIGETPDRRDQHITQAFKQFVATRNQHQPFFSFLFYDTAHSYCSAKNLTKPFQPIVAECNRLALTNQSDPTPYLNRYKNALVFVDNQIQSDIEALKQNHLLDDTLIIITGDHGEEFNDNHLGFWGHAGNFTRYQVQTPLIVYWPKQKPEIFTHTTSHYDVVPTLMLRALGNHNEPTTYSLGKDLLDHSTRPYLIVGSYIDFGIVQADRITTIFPAGNIEVDQLNGHPLPDAKLNIAVMQQAFKDMRRFFS